MSSRFYTCGALCAVVLATASAVRADFDNFTPIPASVGVGTLPEATPFLLGNPAWTQRTLANLQAQTAAGNLDTGAWDMITANETGPDAGRYLYSPMETGAAGVWRHDRLTGTTITIVNPGTELFVSGDMSKWTPWGTYLTAEEAWGGGSTKGRLFEITNPVTTTGPATTNFVARTIIPRVSHEGLNFDKNNNMYFIDELNGGSVYRFTSNNPNATNGNDFFASGTSYVMRVGDGNTFGGTGTVTWVAMTDSAGVALPGATSVTISGGTFVDGRATADVAAFKGTEYNRPEDTEIQTLADGSQRIYFTTTDAQQVFAIHLKNDGTSEVTLFASRNTINAANGLAVGNAFTSPDNLAIDSKGNIYIIEDQPGGMADIWFATDADRDGVAESISRWATMSTAGAEPTGLYFDKFNPNLAYVNVQHPNTNDDRLIEISAVVPEPAAIGILALGLGVLGLRRRRA